MWDMIAFAAHMLALAGIPVLLIAGLPLIVLYFYQRKSKFGRKVIRVWKFLKLYFG